MPNADDSPAEGEPDAVVSMQFEVKREAAWEKWLSEHTNTSFHWSQAVRDAFNDAFQLGWWDSITLAQEMIKSRWDKI